MGSNYEERVRQKHQAQINNEENNPCFKEHQMSLKCLDDNNYDHEACQLHFENYRNCKEFWNFVRRQRRINGITPLLPPVGERDAIKTKFLQTGQL